MIVSRELRILHFVLAFLTAGFHTVYGQTSTHNRSKSQLATHATRLVGRTNVLSIFVRPGCEDFRTLAYFRNVQGANIVNLYVANGEAGESDREGHFPLQLAAVRRQEAVKAMTRLDGEAVFLNLPDIVAAEDTNAVLKVWSPDSLRTKIAAAIVQYKPDIVLLGMDRFVRERPIWHIILEREIKTAIAIAGSDYALRWTTDRFLVEGKWRNPISVSGKLPDKSYLTLAQQAAEEYRSLTVQRRFWDSSAASAYRVVSSTKPLRGSKIDFNLPLPPERELNSLARQVNGLALSLRQARVDTQKALRRTTSILDSIDSRLITHSTGGNRGRRDLLLWKGELENIRNTLLGVTVSYRMSESVLTPKQVVFFTIDSVSGLTRDGETEVFIPAVGSGWLLDEDVKARLQLRVDEPYRLVSPQFSDYDLPYQEVGLARPVIGHPLFIFVIHTAKERERSFTYRIVFPFLFAPRFTVEIMTPIVAMVPGELLAVRLTNHSRDGVRDRLEVDDSLVTAMPLPFRINIKGESHLDTVLLNWSEKACEGTHLIPVSIGGVRVAGFAARRFSFGVDSSKRVGLITGIQNSPLLTALRRLGFKETRVLSPEGPFPDTLNTDVVFVDRRALTLGKNPTRVSDYLTRFSETGGHVVMLAQDETPWNDSPFKRFFALKGNTGGGSSIEVEFDSTNCIMLTPNRIAAQDFENYLFQKNHNQLTGLSDGFVVKNKLSGEPLVISFAAGKGRITYVDLEISSQLMNVHSGTYRFLANLISVTTTTKE